jgi:processive 1,2-diacylglycerol beta-glucosyltransferase
MRILILTASYGSGHNEAARSLAAAFEREGAETLVIDHFRALVDPRFERASRALYYTMLRRAPLVWGMAYALGDWMSSDSRLSFGVTRLGTERLVRVLETLAPDAVVTVHATPAVVMSRLRELGQPVPPHTTVVTDFVAHSQWIAPHIDRYCVAAEEVKHEFIARGIPAERIMVTGVPLRAEFEQPVSQQEARLAFGLSGRTPVVLAMAGSNGRFGRLPATVRALKRVPSPLQAVVVAGRDDALAERLKKLTAGSSIRVLGYVPEIRRLMATADLLITKAGGMTLAEAMAVGLPLVSFGSLPGQEQRNERFASRAGVALVARSPRDLEHTIERALTTPGLLEQLRHRTSAVSQPEASRRIVAAVLGRDLFSRAGTLP